MRPVRGVATTRITAVASSPPRPLRVSSRRVTVYAVAVFALTYLLIVKRSMRLVPLGRAAGALLGAVLMTLGGVLSPKEAYAAIDPETIALLFGMMTIAAYLAEARVLEVCAAAFTAAAPSPRAALAFTSIAAGVLSALLVNDTVCLFATPIVVLYCRRSNLPVAPFLMAVATSSNLGSIGTLVGNPQIMLIGARSGIGFGAYFATMAPIAAALLAVNTALLVAWYGRSLPRVVQKLASEPIAYDRVAAKGGVLCLVAVFVAFFLGADMAWTSLAGAVALLWLRVRDPAEIFARVDWKLLVFFAGLFVVTKGLDSTGLSATWTAALYESPWYVPWIVVGSNVFSNVPMVLLAGPHAAAAAATPAAAEHAWLTLALVSTTAGNLTLVGSAANIIVAEQAELPFLAHLRFGVVTTLLTTALGLAMLG
jgi:Na+/H+ antiporter NhaD/arsenite permease-like protein